MSIATRSVLCRGLSAHGRVLGTAADLREATYVQTMPDSVPADAIIIDHGASAYLTVLCDDGIFCTDALFITTSRLAKICFVSTRVC